MENKKTLKFDAHLADLILAGTKTSTWRLFDDKDLKMGDVVVFIRRPDLIPFAKARLTKVFEKPLGELSQEEMSGHETYDSADQMCATFEKYYNKPVNAETLVKVISFELID